MNVELDVVLIRCGVITVMLTDTSYRISVFFSPFIALERKKRGYNRHNQARISNDGLKEVSLPGISAGEPVNHQTGILGN